MIKLLTKKEQNAITEGTTKQVKMDWLEEADFIMLNMAFRKLGLKDYFEMELQDNKLCMRIIEE